MSSFLNNDTILEGTDAIRIPDGGKSVSDHNGCAASLDLQITQELN